MVKAKFSHRVLATFLAINFLSTIIPVNQLLANNNGPAAPEASSFEPVDATDMVNLATGDLSYVLPLLNVPSPEGGYPLSLAYHAGIAMDQEASWVGLGWNLNPGAINRSVNGYPDDWGKTYINEFLYDQGGTDSYYNFSLGGTFSNGVTVGLGASWGSNQAFGGSVSFGYGGVKGTAGTNGVGVGITFLNAISAGYHTKNGISVGYQRGGTSVGYSSNDGFSISQNFSHTGKFSKYASVGISLSSKGLNTSSSIANNGTISKDANSLSGDYDVNIQTRGLNLDFGLFWLRAQRHKVNYSLFKMNNLYVSGIAYPYKSMRSEREVNPTTESTEIYLEADYLMDTEEFTADTTFPSYDNYSVNSQGMSGLISPNLFEELPLSYKGKSKDSDGSYNKYIHAPFSNLHPQYTVNDLGNRTHFNFKNSASSFLRIKKGEVVSPVDYDQISEENNIASLFQTANNTDYSDVTTPDGNQIRSGYKMRDGRNIQTYTNEQIEFILNNNLNNGFVEAKGLDRTNEDIFQKEGIGAFKITSVDGKTYHYSLPVYQFEVIRKAFTGLENEDIKYFEEKKIKPYATHWLLTAVTGPDYVDINNNGSLDESDYGYWVEFEYGKWSDGFGWRFPKEDFIIVKDTPSSTDESKYDYSYTMGRKQIYYLDAIKTRSHTALFVKSLRKDGKGADLTFHDQVYNDSGSFNESYCESKTSQGKKNFSLPGEQYYNNGSTPFEFPYVEYNVQTPGNNLNVIQYQGYVTDLKYIDVPSSHSLRLDKIVLLDNDNFSYDSSSHNNLGNPLTSNLNGHIYINEKFTDIYSQCQAYNTVYPDDVYYEAFSTELHRFRKNYLKSFQTNLYQNVLDINDYNSLNLNQYAQKVIEFDYDESYPLATNSPNSSANSKGRLTLDKVNFLGKQGAQVMPSYTFDYNLPTVSYDWDKLDNWGYHKDHPEAWSLSSIQTPIGATIDIEYEQDSYYGSARGLNNVWQEFDYNPINNTSDVFEIENYTKTDDGITINFKTGSLVDNLDYYFSLDQIIEVGQKYNHSTSITTSEIGYIDYYVVEEMYNKDWIKLKKTSITERHEDLYENPCLGNSERNCLKKLSIKGNTNLHTLSDPNGTEGGGLRVKNIATQNSTSSFKNQVNYKYTNPINNKISGITSYVPSEPGEEPELNYVHGLPAPGVMYEFVSVENIDDNNMTFGETRYHFDVLKQTTISDINQSGYQVDDEGFFELFDMNFYKGRSKSSFENLSAPSSVDRTINRTKFNLYSSLASIGRLLSITNMNQEGHIISRKVNKYKANFDEDGSIGVKQESFTTSTFDKKVTPASELYPERTDYEWSYSSTSKIEYPSILESTTTMESGISQTVYYNKHDFLTGQALETEALDSKGNQFKTELIPAYTKYSDMGAKVDNITNKNMLTQETMSKTYLKVNDQWKETGVGISTWNNEWTYTNQAGTHTSPTNSDEKVWRKHKTYTWQGNLNSDGTLQAYTDNFDWSLNTSAQANQWKQLSEITKYDHYSMPLEIEDINGNRGATKTGDNSSKVLATGNARYGEMFYTGAEYESPITATTYIDQQIKMDNGAVRTGSKFHTGKYSVEVPVGGRLGAIYKGNEYRTGKYKISVWVHKENHLNARIQGVPFNGEILEAGDWVLMNHYITFSTNTVDQFPYVTSTSGNLYIDDYRIHPISSSMATYVYNEWDELSYILDGNNLGTYYEYDKAGKLIRTSKEVIDNASVTGGFKKVSESNYHYKNN